MKLAACLLLADITVESEAVVPPSQRQALVDLYDATQGQHWQNRTHWLIGDPCEDSWFGISCDPINTMITCVVGVCGSVLKILVHWCVVCLFTTRIRGHDNTTLQEVVLGK